MSEDTRRFTETCRGDTVVVELLGAAEALTTPYDGPITAAVLAAHAIGYAARGWRVFPLRGKVPAIAGGRGFHDATTDVTTVCRWWAQCYRGANIGAQVPDNMIVIDVDPRNGGLETLIELELRHGARPDTLTVLSGRADGGHHLYFRRPPGVLSGARLGAGLDLKTCNGYVVVPPSLHPDTGRPYTLIPRAVADVPMWLAGLLQPAPPPPRYTASGAVRPGNGRYTLKCLVRRIESAREGHRNTTVFGAFKDAAADGNLTDWERDLTAAALATGLVAGEVESILRSAHRSAA